MVVTAAQTVRSTGAMMSELIDNRSHRIRTLKEIMQQLHRGADPDAVRGALRTIVRETSSFRPAPLIELLESRGFRAAVVRSGAAFATFIGPRQAGS
jgi:hypothetical protein